MERAAENGGVRGKRGAVAGVDAEVVNRRRSGRIQKMESVKGKAKVSMREEMECEVEKSRKRIMPQSKKKKPQIKKRKVVESVVVGGARESKIVVNAANRVDKGHWVLVNGRPHVKGDERSKEQKAADEACVKKTLSLFNQYFHQSKPEEEKRCMKKNPDRKQYKPQKKVKGGKLKKVDSDSEGSDRSTVEMENCNAVKDKRTSKRPDIKAIGKMKATNSILFPKAKIGSMPGISVGDRFFSRAEMSAIGFHRPTLSGIYYMGKKFKKEYKSYNFPIAVSVVLSGLYEDDTDNLEEVLYTGQGGNDLLGNKRQTKDQELELGNLALKNCIEQSVPVRVVRGHKDNEGYVGRAYTYDGLYEVLECLHVLGMSGFYVYKFRLRRLGGQPKLLTKQVLYAFGKAEKLMSSIKGVICEDISMGMEKIRIPATNLVDDTPFPADFTYQKSMIISEKVKMPTSPTGCDCEGACTDPNVCSCAKRNHSDFPYIHSICEGKSLCYRLIEPTDVVYECGPGCGCGPDCVNRASQRGIEYSLEVFRTLKKGWAVRSWDYIPSGALICEYIGVLKRTEELDSAQNNDYIFDIDCIQTMKGLDGREKRYRNESNNILDINDQKSDAPEYCIDAGSEGNVARFINHSCEPNLFVQCVLSSHRDKRLARIVLVAAENIPPLQELTYDYGYALDSVVDSDGKPIQLACHCGATNCRKRLY